MGRGAHGLDSQSDEEAPMKAPMPRRRRMRKGQAKGVRHLLAAALAAIAVQVAVVSAYLVQPVFLDGRATGTDLAEVFGVMRAPTRLDIIQLFGGHTAITEAAKRDLRCGQVVDEIYGHDLRQPIGPAVVRELCGDNSPEVAHN